ncbi:E3 ubiquitin-protein ligase TRIM71-like [Ptychodera flava]|uniref:E3 ubiquitin-protein ligase TRIM71-like n=1 Tax=Ptychodera flava TaxID=63121 RepID=UPI00396A61B1
MVPLCREAFTEKYRRDMLRWAIDRKKIEGLEETKSSYEARIKELQGAKDIADEVATRERTKLTVSSKVDVLKKRRKIEELDIGQCEGCKEREAVHSCIECDLNFCSSCITAHEDMETSKSQREVKLDKYLEELSGELSKQSKVHCSIHPQNEVHLFCDSCQVSICPDCIATHPVPDHVHRDLQDAADQYREQLKEMVEKLKKHEQTAKSHGSDEAAKDELEIYRQEEEDKINRKAKRMIQKTELEKSRLIRTLKFEFDMIKESVMAEFDEWEEKYGNISKACNYLESMLHDGNAARLLSSKKETMQNIQNFVHNMNQLIKSELIKFQPSADPPEHGMLGLLKMDVSASMCTVENMPTRLVRGKSVNVIVRITDRRGKPVISYKEITAKMWKEDGSCEDIVAVDNGNGTHSLRIDADVGGRHKVTVELGDQPIPGSPFVISIKGLVKTIGKGQLKRPAGITTNKHGDFVTADKGNNRIHIADRDGNYKSSFTFTQFEKPFVPRGVAVSADDEYFMSDSGNNQVVVSDEDGQLLRYFGQNELKYAIGIAISPLDGSVYVTDWNGKGADTDKGSHCVRKFTQHGQYIKSFGKYGTKQGEFKGPGYVAINSQGEVFVSDVNNSRVQVFSADCEFLYSFHNISSDDTLSYPRGIEICKENYVYICDKGNKRVLKLDRRGRFISRIDSDEDGLDFPHGITLTNDVPCRVAVVDHTNDCIKVFAQ